MEREQDRKYIWFVVLSIFLIFDIIIFIYCYPSTILSNLALIDIMAHISILYMTPVILMNKFTGRFNNLMYMTIGSTCGLSVGQFVFSVYGYGNGYNASIRVIDAVGGMYIIIIFVYIIKYMFECLKETFYYRCCYDHPLQNVVAIRV